MTKFVYASYANAANAAMEMLDGLDESAFYDTFTIQGRRRYTLNYKGVRVLAGVMGVRIESIEETDLDENMEVKAISINVDGHHGFSFISQPKKMGNGKPDPDYREKAFTRAKRNALRDLVPDQVFCEMLVKNHMTKATPLATKPVTKQTQRLSDVEESKRMARKTAADEKEKLSSIFGISIEDCINFAEESTGLFREQWTANQWEYLSKILKNPEDMGMELSKDPDNSPDLADEEDAVEDIVDDSSMETDSQVDSDLEEVISDMEKSAN